MNQHVIAHGRMFNEIDDEKRQAFASSAPVRDELFGSPEKIGKEIIPVGEQITINGQPFTIIGMFEHYESEQDKKARLAGEGQATPNTSRAGAQPRLGWRKVAGAVSFIG